jgi:hypothetical protein
MENPKKTEPQSIKDIFGNKPKPKKPPAHQWQDLALQIIDQLDVPAFKRNSVFLICKKHSRAYVERCLNDTKELCKTGEKWKYFFKVIAGSEKK